MVLCIELIKKHVTKVRHNNNNGNNNDNDDDDNDGNNKTNKTENKSINVGNKRAAQTEKKKNPLI